MKKIFSAVICICLCYGVFGNSILASKKDRVTLLLETVGLMSAQGLYLTYVAIGSAADGYAKKAYDDKTAIMLFSEYIKVTELAQKQLNTLLVEKAVEGEDIQYVNELIATYSILIKEATSFKDYITKKDDKLIKIYEENRKQAWKKITELLDIPSE